MEHDHSGLMEATFHDLGLGLTFGDHVDERDDFDLAPIGSRVADLHAAFADAGVRGILTVIGGFNSNELLPHLDWNLIAQNPKGVLRILRHHRPSNGHTSPLATLPVGGQVEVVTGDAARIRVLQH